VGFNYTWTHFIIFLDVLLALACAASIRSWWRFVRRRIAPSERWYGGQWSDLLKLIGGVVILLAFSAAVLLAVVRLEQSMHVESIVTRVDAPMLRVEPDARREEQRPAAKAPASPFDVFPRRPVWDPMLAPPKVLHQPEEVWALLSQSPSHRLAVFEGPSASPRTICIAGEHRFVAYERTSTTWQLVRAYDNVTAAEGARLLVAGAPSTLAAEGDAR